MHSYTYFAYTICRVKFHQILDNGMASIAVVSSHILQQLATNKLQFRGVQEFVLNILRWQRPGLQITLTITPSSMYFLFFKALFKTSYLWGYLLEILRIQADFIIFICYMHTSQSQKIHHKFITIIYQNNNQRPLTNLVMDFSLHCRTLN